MSRNTAKFDRGIDLLIRSGAAAHVPLLEAARDGLLDIVFTGDRKAAIPFGRIRKSPRPVLMLVGDDDAYPTGPAGWTFASKITRWAKGAVVHGTGAQREHYEMAVRGALICRRFLVVDTASRHTAAWAALLKHVQTLILVPRCGEHPIASVAETMH